MMDRRTFVGRVAGGLLAMPLAARAQQPTIPMIGFLGSASSAQWSPFVAAFRNGLNETGHVEGQNVAIEFHWADGRYDRLPALAADLVQRKVSVIVATGGSRSGLAAKAATSTIPIVFTTGGDPVTQGLVASLGRPGGNVTGISFFTSELLLTKRLELLHELVPKATEIALIVNPTGVGAESSVSKAQQQANSFGQRLRVLRVSTEQDIDAAIATFAQLRPDGLIIEPDPVLNARREQFVALAARYAVPAVYEGRESVIAGGLMSYGPSLSDAYRQVGIYTGRILKGAKPADLPVLRPTKFELVINLKTAKALDLAIPRSLLLRADEVIQ
jgi:putative tryptophan/tyrosine transport system substrate-binding protein